MNKLDTLSPLFGRKITYGIALVYKLLDKREALYRAQASRTSNMEYRRESEQAAHALLGAKEAIENSFFNEEVES